MSTFLTTTNDSIYWNGKYAAVVNYLMAQEPVDNEQSEQADVGSSTKFRPATIAGEKVYPVFKTYAEVCLFAAIVAVKRGLISESSASKNKDPKQIRLIIFQNQRLIGTLWSLYFLTQPIQSIELLDLSSEFDNKVISQLTILIDNGLAFLTEQYHPEYEFPPEVFVSIIQEDFLNMTPEYFNSLLNTDTVNH